MDRVKDLVLASGFNVYRGRSTSSCTPTPRFCEACAYGVPDPKRGETIKLALVLKPGESMTVAEARDFCKAHLSAYKVPTDVVFMDELPLTAIGKANRKMLRQMESEKN